MPVFKNENNGTWYVMARYVNWKGERKQKCKRGFATKKEAQEWERMFQLQNSSDMDMSFEAFRPIVPIASFDDFFSIISYCRPSLMVGTLTI